MELKKHFNSKVLFFTLYYVAFAIYIIIGLQPAKATDYNISGSIVIPSIDLVSDVTSLSLNNGKLDTPDTIVGSYSRNDNKTLLIGHSTTVFQALNQLNLGDEIQYNGQSYRVDEVAIVAKGDISMAKLLKGETTDNLVVMTCAGELLGNGDATHRLIVTASAQ